MRRLADAERLGAFLRAMARAADEVQPARLRELFERIEPELYRYPALNPASFRQAVDIALQDAEPRP